MDRDDTTKPNIPSSALHRYMSALEQGNIETVAAILQLAETDAVLERMLLAINDAYLDQQHSLVDDEESQMPANQTVEPERAALLRTEHIHGGQGVPSARQPRQPRMSTPRWLGTFAAVLAVVALLGGFFALFSTHGSSTTAHGEKTPAAATQQPTSAVATQQPTVAPGDTIIIVGTQQGSVTALKVSSGQAIWRWSSGILDSFVSSANIVYIASHTSPSDPGGMSQLTALQTTTGAKLWQETEPQLAGYTYMALDGNILLATSGYGDGTVYALDAHTGKMLWLQPGIGGLTNRLITSTRGITYLSTDEGVGNFAGGFRAYDAGGGKLLWKYDTGSGPATTMGTNGPTIIAGNNGLVYYYNFDLVSQPASTAPMVVTFTASTGVIQQTLTFADIGNPVLVTANGIVYTVQDSQFCAFQIAGGKRLWCTVSLATAAMDGGLRLVATPSALLYSLLTSDNHTEVGALDNATGSQIWSWQGPTALNAGVLNAISLVGDKDRLYMTTRQGLYTFQASTGTLLWHALATTDLSFIQPALAG